jgi:hypothetical protein
MVRESEGKTVLMGLNARVPIWQDRRKPAVGRSSDQTMSQCDKAAFHLNYD